MVAETPVTTQEAPSPQPGFPLEVVCPPLVSQCHRPGEGGGCAHDSSSQDSAGGRVNSVAGGQRGVRSSPLAGFPENRT